MAVTKATAKKSTKSTSKKVTSVGEASKTAPKLVSVKEAEAELSKTSAKTIGQVFQELRLSRSEALETISLSLKISERYLKALEEMQKDDLPEKVYTLGFVRSYAHYLGVDPQKSVTKFKKDMYESGEKDSQLRLPKPVDDSEFPTKKFVLVTFIMAVLIFAGVGLYQEMKRPPVAQEVESVLPDTIEAAPVTEDLSTLDTRPQLSVPSEIEATTQAAAIS